MEPPDLHDYDGVNENVLIDLEWQGELRQTLVHPERNGYVYLIDRLTGEVLTTSTGVDLETGRLIYNPEKAEHLGRVTREICPASPGAKDWQPSAYSPETGLLYIPHNNFCQDAEPVSVSYIAGTPYLGMEVRIDSGPGGHRGELTAWDVAAGREVWTVEESFPVWSGVAVTAGGLVFYGTMDGWFKAVSAKSGELLWQFKVGSGIVGQPTVFLGPDGKQYVAILSGVGGWTGSIVAGGLDARDATAALGFVNAMQDLPQHTGRGSTLYVFSLP